MSHPRVLMMSIWRNDANRHFDRRVQHLLGKTYPNLTLLWLVGDSTDETETLLRNTGDPRVTVIRRDSAIEGEDSQTRIRRLNRAAHDLLDAVPDRVDYCVLHDSDLVTPLNIVERFLATGKCPVAGVPMLDYGSHKVFYDTLGFSRDGRNFSNHKPYHPCYTADALFEVDSFGACYMFEAKDARDGVRPDQFAMVGFSWKLKEIHGHLWVDPSIEVIQPVDLWTQSLPPVRE